MAERHIVVDLEVDDRGATRSLNDLERTTEKLSATASRTASVGLLQMETAMSRASATGVLAGTAIAQLAERVVDWGVSTATHAATAGARLEQLGAVAGYLGERSGYSADFVSRLADQMKRTGITGVEANQAIIQFTRAGFDLNKVLELQAAAQNAASIAGESSSEVLGRLIHGITTLQPEVLRSAGYIVNLEAAEKAFATETGRTIQQLTGHEKQQILLNEVLRQAGDLNGVYALSMEHAAKQQQSATRAWEQAAEEIGTRLLPATSAIAKANLSLAESARDNPEIFLGLTASATSLAGAMSGLLFMQRFPAIFTSIGSAAVAMQTSLLGLVGIWGAVGAAAAGATVWLTRQVEDLATAKLRAEEAAAGMDSWKRAVSLGMDPARSVAEAIEFLNQKFGRQVEVAAAAAREVDVTISVFSKAGAALTRDIALMKTSGETVEILARRYDTTAKAIQGFMARTNEFNAAAEAAKKQAAEWKLVTDELDSAGRNWHQTLLTLDGEIVSAVQFYLQAGVAQDTLRKAYALTAIEMRALIEAHKAYELQLQTEMERQKAAVRADVESVDMAITRIQARMDAAAAASQQEQSFLAETMRTAQAADAAMVTGASEVASVSTEAARQTQSAYEISFMGAGAAFAAFKGGVIQGSQEIVTSAFQVRDIYSQVLNAIGIPTLRIGLRRETYPLQTREQGGPVWPGGRFLVGERGPEVFVPGTRGTILPAGRSGNVIVNVNVGSVDSDSRVRQLTDAVESTLGRALSRDVPLSRS
jgi:hypothetical protein